MSVQSPCPTLKNVTSAGTEFSPDVMDMRNRVIREVPDTDAPAGGVTKDDQHGQPARAIGDFWFPQAPTKNTPAPTDSRPLHHGTRHNKHNHTGPLTVQATFAV
ncbi:3',5'-cyclic-nucleotide phosphodiesterase [Streptomyces sp. NBRC 110611]|nr:3',5'-cyclic-nucleotide phosphodiesterase [Streptomyces sp. NBRC 110611]